jgi:hypothetical protein
MRGCDARHNPIGSLLSVGEQKGGGLPSCIRRKNPRVLLGDHTHALHAPLPAALDDRRQRRLFHREGQKAHALARRVLCGGAWPAVGGYFPLIDQQDYFVVERKQAGDHLLQWAFSRAHDTVMPRMN